DFLCQEAQLIVELDGYSHDLRQAYDSRRDRWLAENGYRVLRFTNDDVMSNIEGVVIEIERVLANMPSRDGRHATPVTPSHKWEGDT
ncbi:MAG: hypothetical protein C0520_16495, partial [Sphingopyxis sp.]|nr:hypothetical protein [Sphingopyxis sp.]